MSGEQIPIPFAVGQSMTWESFFPAASNEAIRHLLEIWPDWQSPVVLLEGPVGSGKTHASHLWAGQSGAQFWEQQDLAAFIPSDDVDATHNIILESPDAYLDSEIENQLFHLINHLRASKKFLLLTSRQPLNDWPLTLPDLQSRLQAALRIRLQAPDDALLSAVIVKLFADRQVEVSMQTIQFMTSRMNRSLGEAQRLVAKIDAEAMRRKSRITRTIVADILSADDAS